MTLAGLWDIPRVSATRGLPHRWGLATRQFLPREVLSNVRLNWEGPSHGRSLQLVKDFLIEVRRLRTHDSDSIRIDSLWEEIV